MAASLRSFIESIDEPKRSLVVVNRSSPRAAQRLLGEMLDDQPIDLREISADGEGSDVVLLVEDDEILARSPMDDLLSSVLLVNSDLYKTGARSLEEIELPAVLERLDDVPFHARGYPASNKEKLLLITISRVIERKAAEVGAGTLRSSFQQLSRIDDEQGTRTVYETVGRTGTDVHVYGVPDWNPQAELSVTVHGGHSEEYRHSWFVVFTPANPAAADDHIGLVAVEDEQNRNVWDGFWTTRPELVREIDAYIQRNL